MKKLFLFLTALFAFSSAVNAELSLKNPCADGMVIQQNTDAVIWGFASPGSTITVQPSWSKLKYHVTTDDSGEWKASRTPLTTMPAARLTLFPTASIQ